MQPVARAEIGAFIFMFDAEDEVTVLAERERLRDMRLRAVGADEIAGLRSIRQRIAIRVRSCAGERRAVLNADAGRLATPGEQAHQFRRVGCEEIRTRR
jgi:hypothetical protein